MRSLPAARLFQRSAPPQESRARFVMVAIELLLATVPSLFLSVFFIGDLLGGQVRAGEWVGVLVVLMLGCALLVLARMAARYLTAGSASLLSHGTWEWVLVGSACLVVLAGLVALALGDGVGPTLPAGLRLLPLYAFLGIPALGLALHLAFLSRRAPRPGSSMAQQGAE